MAAGEGRCGEGALGGRVWRRAAAGPSGAVWAVEEDGGGWFLLGEGGIRGDQQRGRVLLRHCGGDAEEMQNHNPRIILWRNRSGNMRPRPQQKAGNHGNVFPILNIGRIQYIPFTSVSYYAYSR